MRSSQLISIRRSTAFEGALRTPQSTTSELRGIWLAERADLKAYHFLSFSCHFSQSTICVGVMISYKSRSTHAHGKHYNGSVISLVAQFWDLSLLAGETIEMNKVCKICPSFELSYWRSLDDRGEPALVPDDPVENLQPKTVEHYQRKTGRSQHGAIGFGPIMPQNLPIHWPLPTLNSKLGFKRSILMTSLRDCWSKRADESFTYIVLQTSLCPVPLRWGWNLHRKSKLIRSVWIRKVLIVPCSLARDCSIVPNWNVVIQTAWN